MNVTLIGIDLAKSVFQVCGVNQAGQPLFNRQVRRAHLLPLVQKYPDAVVAMEACGGSNHWGRTLIELGFTVRLIPPQHVKPFVKGNKNDRNDAFAITEAARRPNLRFVEPRTLEQTDMAMVLRVRERLILRRTALINQLRGLLREYGLVAPKGRKAFALRLPDLLEDAENGLTVVGRRMCDLVRVEWRSVDEQLATLDRELKDMVQTHAGAQRLLEINGVGEKVAIAAVAFAGRGQAYKNGRHFAANLGLTPREHSSGGHVRLGGVTKRGNSYLRQVLVQGAWTVVRLSSRKEDRLSRWARSVAERRGRHKAVVAVANKIARIIWSMLYHQTAYRAG